MGQRYSRSHRRSQTAAAAAAVPAQSDHQNAEKSASADTHRSYICVSVTSSTLQAFLAEIAEVEAAGADIVELRLDFLQEFDTERDLKYILAACTKPYIVTYRPTWEGGHYAGPEPERLATLKFAAMLGAPHVDVEYKAAAVFFASAGEVTPSCRVILSSHNFQQTPPATELQQLARDMHAAGADIVKIATMANDITDTAAVLSLLMQGSSVPTIALAMGEKGVISRLLAAKYGGYLTFATLSAERASAPGQPNLPLLRGLYNFQGQHASSQVFGIIGMPVSHSRSPLIHNTAFQHLGVDAVYVPLLVDDLHRFLDAFAAHTGMQGFSVTIPHKEAALKACKEVDPVAAAIGAVNTLIRQPDGSFKGFNTDWVAAIEAIEKQFSAGPGTPTTSGVSPLKGKTFLVLGAGGAGRALAFGAASRGATVLVANRSRDRAQQLVDSMAPGAAQVVDWSALQAGAVKADVLANTTSVGMYPQVHDSPVPASSISNYGLVFDAVYTPLWTQLLLDARAANCQVVDGLQMFVGQAVRQFELFTGKPAPEALMQQTLLDALQQASASAQRK